MGSDNTPAYPDLLALLLTIPGPAALGKIVDGGKLNEGGEDEGITHGHEPVHSCSIGHFG